MPGLSLTIINEIELIVFRGTDMFFSFIYCDDCFFTNTYHEFCIIDFFISFQDIYFTYF